MPEKSNARPSLRRQAARLAALLLVLSSRSPAQQGVPDIDQLEKQLETQMAKQKGPPAPHPEPKPTDTQARWRVAEPYTGPLQMIPSAGGRASFKMGDPTDDTLRKSERPAHPVQLPAFVLAQRAVTRGQFQRFVVATRYKTEAERAAGAGAGCVSVDLKSGTRTRGPGHSWRDPGFKQTDDHPVVCVSWTDAQAYIQWLNSQTHEQFRLPTEAEWEYAARAGAPPEAQLGWSRTRTELTEEELCRYENTGDQSLRLEEMKLVPRGTAPGHRWVRCEDGYAYTSPVAKFEMNGFALHDMNGNVSAWIEDCWHADFNGAPTDGSAWDSKGTDRCEYHVVRGSNWASWPRELRISHRHAALGVSRSGTLGFRLALTP